MKISSLCLLLLLFSMQSFCQMLFFGGGANLAFTNVDALNFIVDQYNLERTDTSIVTLTQPMPHFHNISGIALTFGVVKATGFQIDMGWYGKNETVSAQGTSLDTIPCQLDAKLRNNTFSFGFGYAKPHGVVKPGFEISADIGMITTHTRERQISDISHSVLDAFSGWQVETSDVNFALTFAGNIFIHFGKNSPVGILLKPYYQLSFTNVNFYLFNDAITPYTAVNADPDAQVGKVNAYGICLILFGAKKSDNDPNYTY